MFIRLSTSAVILGCVLTVGCAGKPKQEAKREPTAAEQATAQLDADRNNYVNQAQARIDSIEKFASDLDSNAANADKVKAKKMQNASDDIISLTEEARKELLDVKTAAPQNWLDERRDVERTLERAEATYSNSMRLIQ